MLDQMVSPPRAGRSMARSVPYTGGSTSQLTSVCQRSWNGGWSTSSTMCSHPTVVRPLARAIGCT